MRRYKFLKKDDVYQALNRLGDAFLAAKNGEEVDEIINGLLTTDEKIKIGRRILVAEYIKSGLTLDEIARQLKVGRNTIVAVMRHLDQYPLAYELVEKRNKKVENEYREKKYRHIGSSQVILKRKEYTGFKRKNVER